MPRNRSTVATGGSLADRLPETLRNPRPWVDTAPGGYAAARAYTAALRGWLSANGVPPEDAAEEATAVMAAWDIRISEFYRLSASPRPGEVAWTMKGAAEWLQSI